MDVLTPVAVSMLPASRGRVAMLYSELRHGDSRWIIPRLLGKLGFPPEQHTSIEETARRDAEQALARASGLGMQVVPLGSDQYPPLLACTSDPPPVLWVVGDLGCVTRAATIAVVGSRGASGYALEVGHRLAGELASRGIVVASGLARGVDSAAHRGCLAQGGATVAVLGSGLDRIYPAEHRELAATISKQGVLLSELGPGGPPLAEHFPLRNRIISGISLAVVVVEASEKSGSLITARYALEQGREVMAVPGSVLSGRNRGSHSLLKDGAKVIETADDILEGLLQGPWGAAVSEMARAPGRATARSADPLLARMEAGESYSLDELVELSGTNAARLLPRLTELELAGRLAGRGGRWKVC
jgi:DNA processing protein